MHLDPAASVIDALGGVGAVAKHLGLNPSTVRRFQYDRARSGTGGFIPYDHMFSLMLLSIKLGKPLSLEAMVLTPDQRAELKKLAQSSPQTETASPRKSVEVTQ
ncbi:hypothetical protein [Roseibium sediminicola]|uniref:Uncharacterized protein n=1 Tax=Roseibium sediminicola TaxID=2933272 RepID=A0ABT0H0J1_9HYPH|nr:hypothetical protein [Roseibium sp. CAU 1639]MCK7615215.1 hypothetical protein [Roseibium sp. CAU 1639]